MLTDLFPKASKRFRSLPVLGPVTVAYEAWLLERGYACGSRRNLLRAVRRIDQILEFFGRPEARGSGEEAGHLVAKRSVVGMFLNCHQLQRVVTSLDDSWKHP